MKIFLCFLFLFYYKLFYCSQNTSCYEYSCEVCNSEKYGDCIKCKDSFLLVNGTCPCEDFGCALCSEGFIGSYCYLCKNGYVLENNHCECKQENCEICGKNNCIKCKRGYSFNESKAECEKNDCSISNCDLCSINEELDICYKCKDGYYYDNGNCLEIINQDDDLGQCPKQDEYEFYTYCDVKCTEYGCNIPTNINNYKFCNASNCIICIDDILYLYTDCKSDTCNIEGCNSCLTKNECGRCDRGYKIDLGLCIKCIEGCSVCSNNYSCDYCLSGYELNSQKQCIFTNNFDFDIDIYKQIKRHLNREDIPIKEDDTIKIDEPRKDIKNCISYGENGKCLECKSRHFLYNNKCTKCYDINCLNCQWENNREVCKECYGNYFTYYNSRNCYYQEKCLVSSCEECQPNNASYCQKCNFKFTEVEGKCLSQNEIQSMNEKNETISIKKSGKKVMFMVYILLLVFIFFILFGLAFYLIKKFKKRQIMENMQNIPNVNIQIMNIDSGRNKIKEKSLEEEFSTYKKNNITSSGLNECNICFKKKKQLANFKCGCALMVCKECYIKCKTISNKCPGCRAII